MSYGPIKLEKDVRFQTTINSFLIYYFLNKTNGYKIKFSLNLKNVKIVQNLMF